MRINLTMNDLEDKWSNKFRLLDYDKEQISINQITFK